MLRTDARGMSRLSACSLKSVKLAYFTRDPPILSEHNLKSFNNDNDNDKRLGLTAKADQPDHKNTVH